MNDYLMYAGLCIALSTYIYNNKEYFTFKTIEVYTNLNREIEKRRPKNNYIKELIIENGSLKQLKKISVENINKDLIKNNFNSEDDVLYEFESNKKKLRFFKYNIDNLDEDFITKSKSYISPLISVNINVYSEKNQVKELEITDIFNTFVFPNFNLELDDSFKKYIIYFINSEKNTSIQEDDDIEWVFIESNCNIKTIKQFKINVYDDKLDFN